MQVPKVAIIILNWNGWQDTLECLESLLSIDYSLYDVILIDNGSEDNSIEKIQEYINGKLHINLQIRFTEYSDARFNLDEIRTGSYRNIILIKNKVNYGFAEGSNIGIRFAMSAFSPEYILLLNNDTSVDQRFLNELVDIAESNDKIGMVAAKLLFYENPSIINSVGTLISRDGSAAHLGGREIDHGQYNQVFETFAPCAAAALYRSGMFNETDLLDEDFFAYMEDFDLGFRARLFGWKCFFSPHSLVYHKHSISSKPYSQFKLYHIERNRLLLVLKNYPIKYVLALPLTSFYRYMSLFMNRKSGEVSKYDSNLGLLVIFETLLSAWIDFIKFTPKFIAKRNRIQSTKRIDNSQIEQWFEVFS